MTTTLVLPSVAATMVIIPLKVTPFITSVAADMIEHAHS